MDFEKIDIDLSDPDPKRRDVWQDGWHDGFKAALSMLEYRLEYGSEEPLPEWIERLKEENRVLRTRPVGEAVAWGFKTLGKSHEQ